MEKLFTEGHIFNCHKEPIDCDLIIGEVGSGKTEELVKRLSDALGRGAPPEDMLVFCASPDAAYVFSQRINAVVDTGALRITTPAQYALQILASEKAIDTTKRQARLLVDFEYTFLFEDLKTSGIRPRRLEEMLKFFFKSWTELADIDPSWLVSSEEKTVHSLLKNRLTLLQGILFPELSNLTFNYLLSKVDARPEWDADLVFVDDFSCLNKASQALVAMLAKKSLVVAACEFESSEVCDPYPNAQGLHELAAAMPHARILHLKDSHLPVEIRDACNSLRREEYSEDLELREFVAPEERKRTEGTSGQMVEAFGQKVLSSFKFASFEEELEGLANASVRLIESGASPEDLCFIVPNKSWGMKLETVLKDRGLSVDSFFTKEKLYGDIHSFKEAPILRIYTALRLIANPKDMMSWRAWCGFGDHFANSTYFLEAYTFAHDEGLDLVEAFERMCEDEQASSSMQKILGAYLAGKSLIERLAQLDGPNILEALKSVLGVGADQEVDSVLADIYEPLNSAKAAKDLVQRAADKLNFPHFKHEKGFIKIASKEYTCGLNLKHIVFVAFVNGFVPPGAYFDLSRISLEKKKIMYAAVVRDIYATLGKATKSVTFTYFTRSDLENAEFMDLAIKRIRMEKGVRTCIIEPSFFLKIIFDREDL